MRLLSRYRQCGWVLLLSVALCAQTVAAEVSTAEAPVQAGSPIVEFAKTLLGVPYRRGGVLPETGFDCSGFVQYVFRQLETFVPRSAADLYRQSEKVSVHALQPVQAERSGHLAQEADRPLVRQAVHEVAEPFPVGL